nr:hypothetical protein Iba_chr14bCG13140 [Ipomoea batatas]
MVPTFMERAVSLPTTSMIPSANLASEMIIHRVIIERIKLRNCFFHKPWCEWSQYRDLGGGRVAFVNQDFLQYSWGGVGGSGKLL